MAEVTDYLRVKLAERSTPEGRRTVREMVALLQSDLYDRTGDGPEGKTAIWSSPLGWKVEYGYHKDSGAVMCWIWKPDGSLYAECGEADVYWLEATLP